MAMPQSAVITKKIILPARPARGGARDPGRVRGQPVHPVLARRGQPRLLRHRPEPDLGRRRRRADRRVAQGSGPGSPGPGRSRRPEAGRARHRIARLAPGDEPGRSASLPNEGRDALVALFEIGADTTSLKVLRDDEMLYDRDQAFGGAQLTQLISRQYGFSSKRPSRRSSRRPARRLRDRAARALRRQPGAGDRPRAAVLLHQHAASQGRLRDAGRRHRDPARPRASASPSSPASPRCVVNPFENMKLGYGGPRGQAAARSARRT